MSKPLVLYHANCPDGFCAAWVAHKVFKEDADYIPVQYGEDPSEVAGRRVFILDFSYERSVMRKILSQAHAVVVLDHHKTAQSELDGICDEFCMRPDLIANPPGSELPRIHFDMEQSGARLAWGFFFPGKEAPWIVNYVEDRDLWIWRLPNSKEISAFLGSMPRTFDAWDDIVARGVEFGCGRYVDQGRAILRYQDQLVEQAIVNAAEIDLGGHKILAVNSTVLFSEIAGKLAEGRPFGAVYFVRSDGKRQWSLRSRDGGVDVSEVAKTFGGGGHRNAAGFETKE